MSSIQLEVTRLSQASTGAANARNMGQSLYQTLSVTLTTPWQPVVPEQLLALSLPDDLDLSQEVVISGQIPHWLVGRLLLLCHKAKWLGCYHAPTGGIVVVASSGADDAIAIGDFIPVALNPTPCPAILIGGPPNSGKSVFSNALRAALVKALPQHKIYLHRASWDGEGNWVYEADSPMVETFVRHNEFRIHEDAQTAKLIPDYYRHHAGVVEKLRGLSDCVLVDVGGMPQVEKLPLIKQCTHYVVISRLAAAVEDWHARCGEVLQPLAVVHSVLAAKQEILKEEPYLEIVAGPWTDSASVRFPATVLDKCIKTVLSESYLNE